MREAPSSLSLTSTDEAVIEASLRARGADDDIVRFCLDVRRRDRIIAHHKGRRDHVFIACWPKTGSTWLHRMLLNATGFVDWMLLAHCHDQEQNIDPQWIPMFLVQDTVTRQHCKATQINLRWIESLELRPVVLIRNIFDVIVSMRDHIVHEDHHSPLAHVPESFADWERRRQDAFLARLATPWLLSFVASWEDAASRFPIQWVTYEELAAKPGAVITDILKHSGITACTDAIERAIRDCPQVMIRFNRGVSGRGSELSDEDRDVVRAQVRAFGDGYDFSRIGL